MTPAVPVEEDKLLVHRFSSGQHPDEEPCRCGETTWRAVVVYWRGRPTREVLAQDVIWCDGGKNHGR